MHFVHYADGWEIMYMVLACATALQRNGYSGMGVKGGTTVCLERERECLDGKQLENY